MSYRHGPNDGSLTEKTKLSSTSATAIFTVPSEAGSVAKIDTLLVCNTGAAVDLTVELYDASENASYTLVNRLSAGSNQFGAYTEEKFDFNGMQLDASDELRLTAGTANRIHAVVTVNTPQRQMA